MARVYSNLKYPNSLIHRRRHNGSLGPSKRVARIWNGAMASMTLSCRLGCYWMDSFQLSTWQDGSWLNKQTHFFKSTIGLLTLDYWWGSNRIRWGWNQIVGLWVMSMWFYFDSISLFPFFGLTSCHSPAQHWPIAITIAHYCASILGAPSILGPLVRFHFGNIGIWFEGPTSV